MGKTTPPPPLLQLLQWPSPLPTARGNCGEVFRLEKWWVDFWDPLRTKMPFMWVRWMTAILGRKNTSHPKRRIFLPPPKHLLQAMIWVHTPKNVQSRVVRNSTLIQMVLKTSETSFTLRTLIRLLFGTTTAQQQKIPHPKDLPLGSIFGIIGHDQTQILMIFLSETFRTRSLRAMEQKARTSDGSTMDHGPCKLWRNYIDKIPAFVKCSMKNMCCICMHDCRIWKQDLWQNWIWL